MRAQQLGDKRALVEAALAFTRRVEWNGNEDVERRVAQSLVIEPGDEPGSDQMAQVNLPAVLKIEKNLPNDSAAAIDRDRGVEVQPAMTAIRAGKCVADRGGKR